MKITYYQMIAIFLIVAVVMAVINFLVPYGPYLTMGVMIGVFLIFKIYKSRKKD